MKPMKRREVLKLTATVATLPSLVQALPAPATPDWKPLILDDHQNQTVIVLSDLIIPATDTPGAKMAQVNRYIDRFLNAGPDTEHQRFIGGVAWLDSYSIRRHSHSFIGCTPAQQIAILQTLDANKEPGLEPGHQFFRMAKSMVAQMYYNTEIGYKELNKGGRVPGTFGCDHAPHG
jgi:gluconate 2-dehydrogenase gamma chain